MSMSERELERVEEWLESCRELLGIIDEARVKSEGRTTKATLYQSQQLDKYLRASTSKRMPTLIAEVRRSHAENEQLKQHLDSYAQAIGTRQREAAELRKELAAVRYAHGRLVIENAELRERIEAKDRAANFAESRYEQQQAKLENQGE